MSGAGGGAESVVVGGTTEPAAAVKDPVSGAGAELVAGSPSLAKTENLFDSCTGGTTEVSPGLGLFRTTTSAQVERGVEQKEGRGRLVGSQTAVSWRAVREVICCFCLWHITIKCFSSLSLSSSAVDNRLLSLIRSITVLSYSRRSNSISDVILTKSRLARRLASVQVELNHALKGQ